MIAARRERRVGPIEPQVADIAPVGVYGRDARRDARRDGRRARADYDDQALPVRGPGSRSAPDGGTGLVAPPAGGPGAAEREPRLCRLDALPAGAAARPASARAARPRSARAARPRSARAARPRSARAGLPRRPGHARSRPPSAFAAPASDTRASPASERSRQARALRRRVVVAVFERGRRVSTVRAQVRPDCRYRRLKRLRMRRRTTRAFALRPRFEGSDLLRPKRGARVRIRASPLR